MAWALKESENGGSVEVSEIPIQICRRRRTTLSWNPYSIPSWCPRSTHHCWPSDRCCGGDRRRCSAHRKRRACVFLACRLEPTENARAFEGLSTLHQNSEEAVIHADISSSYFNITTNPHVPRRGSAAGQSAAAQGNAVRKSHRAACWPGEW
jgi:hypothetical protein